MISDIIYLISALVLRTLSFVMGCKFGRAGGLLDARISLAGLVSDIRSWSRGAVEDGDMSPSCAAELVAMLEQKTLLGGEW